MHGDLHWWEGLASDCLLRKAMIPDTIIMHRSYTFQPAYMEGDVNELLSERIWCNWESVTNGLNPTIPLSIMAKIDLVAVRLIAINMLKQKL